MPSLPRRDYSIPLPSGFQLGTDGRRVAFPAIKRAALSVHNFVRRFYPSPDLTALGGSAQPAAIKASQLPDPNRTVPVPFTNPYWPKDHTAVILDKPGVK
jgi:hypothetical protein